MVMTARVFDVIGYADDELLPPESWRFDTVEQAARFARYLHRRQPRVDVFARLLGETGLVERSQIVAKLGGPQPTLH